MPRRGSDWERADSAPGKPNFYQLEDASAERRTLARDSLEHSAERRNSGGANYFVGAPPSPDATPTPMAKKNISAELESASETTMAVLPSSVTPSTPLPGPPVETPQTMTKSTTPKKPKKKSLLKTLSSPIKSIAKKVSPRKKAPPPAPENTSPLSEITADRGSPIAEVSVEDIKALADHVDAALLPSTASRKLPEWVAKLQDAVALNCCKGDASGERGAAQ